jgi:hypothetical protein
MDDLREEGCPRSADISAVVGGIERLFSGAQIYLFSHKLNRDHEVASFKLCVIFGFKNKTEAERMIYMDIDSGVPFDIVLYTDGEWARLSCEPDSFARRVSETGFVVHG